MKIVHFIGHKKPWQYAINLETGRVIYDHGIISVTSSEHFIQKWWDLYNEIAEHRITVRHRFPSFHSLYYNMPFSFHFYVIFN